MRTGGVFGANTLGAVIGAGVAGPVLVPQWGLAFTHDAVVLFLFGIAGLLLVRTEGSWRNWRAAAGAVGAMMVLLAPTEWDPRQLNAGVFRDTAWQGGSLSRWESRMHRNRLLFHEDGPDATVVVLERGGSRVLKVNGKADASDSGDKFTQVISAHLPHLLHPEPKRTLVVGLGSGVTAA